MKNLSLLERKLMAAAQRHPPGDQVPYAFERRIMARLDGVAPPDSWAEWGRGFWRAAAACVMVTFLLGAWSFSPLNHPSGWGAALSASGSENFSQELDRTLLAGLEQGAEEIW